MNYCVRCGNKSKRKICGGCKNATSYSHNKVRCEICHKEFVALPTHLLRTHRTQPLEYKITYPHAPLHSDSFINSVKNPKKKYEVNICTQCGMRFARVDASTLCSRCRDGDKRSLLERRLDQLSQWSIPHRYRGEGVIYFGDYAELIVMKGSKSVDEHLEFCKKENYIPSILDFDNYRAFNMLYNSEYDFYFVLQMMWQLNYQHELQIL